MTNGGGFRTDINGLRAIAVVAVMLFHFAVPGFGGGFVGVDVFFVISGYLMTRIILSNPHLDVQGILLFYLARARRIFPALVALILILLTYGWFNFSPIDYTLLAKHAGASLLFLSNQVYLKESGYFDADAHEKWLLHTWSLSIEWQFYLLYPLLLLLATRIMGRQGGLRAILWLVFIGSLAWSGFLAFTNPAKAFFLLPSRAWEMLAGGLVFLHQRSLDEFLQGKKWPEVLGITAIIAAALSFSHETAWPGLHAMLPVAGAALVIARSEGNTLLLCNAFIQSIGRWSYSIYLWHWPVVVWLYQTQDERNATTLIAGLHAAIIFGWASFRFIEIPSRQWIRRKALPTAFAISITMIMVPFALSTLIHFKHHPITAFRFKGNPRLVDAQAFADFQAKYFNELYKPLFREGSCFMSPEKSFDGFAQECTSASSTIILWGDSHAAHLWPGIASLPLKERPTQWTASGCPPFLGEEFAKRPHCRAINEWVWGNIRSSRPDVIILAAAWVKHEDAVIRRGLNGTLTALRTIDGWNPRIILVGSVPAWRKPLPTLLASDFLAGQESMRSKKGLDPDMARRDNLVRELAEGKAEIFSPIATGCNAEGCLRYLEIEGKRIPFAFDYGHLVKESSIYLAKALYKEMNL